MIYITCPIYCHKVFYIIMEALVKELQSSGYPARIEMLNDNRCSLQNQVVLLFGPQHLQNLSETIQQNVVIVYNLEQLISKNWDALLNDLVYVYQIWDYSQLNVDYTATHFPTLGERHVLVPLGYSKCFQNPNILSTDESTHPTLITDRIAFIGNMSQRRFDILQTLNAVVPIDVYDHHYYNSYEDVVKRYQTFLNLHFHDEPNILEIVRILPLLMNGRKVISEKSEDTTIDSLFSSCVSLVDPHNVDQFRQAVLSPVPNETRLQKITSWKQGLDKGMKCFEYKHFQKDTTTVIATLHCNNRTAIFEVIESFSREIATRNFKWIIYSQGCDADHNRKIQQALEDANILFELICKEENVGWSKGMNALYEVIAAGKHDYVLHLEDDWICEHDDTRDGRWFDDCCLYLHLHTDVSTLFLRKYTNEEDKYMYGWSRSIYYHCFQHPNPFNYQEKIKGQPKIDFRSLVVRRIPEFLYSANPTLFRLCDYVRQGVFPFPEFHDVSNKQGEWKTTTMDDAPQWGFSEAISMEKTRDLVCMNVNKGFFYHRN